MRTTPSGKGVGRPEKDWQSTSTTGRLIFGRAATPQLASQPSAPRRRRISCGTVRMSMVPLHLDRDLTLRLRRLSGNRKLPLRYLLAPMRFCCPVRQPARHRYRNRLRQPLSRGDRSLIGFFVNALAFDCSGARSDLPRDSGLCSHSAVTGYAHADVPSTELWRPAARPKRLHIPSSKHCSCCRTYPSRNSFTWASHHSFDLARPQPGYLRPHLSLQEAGRELRGALDLTPRYSTRPPSSAWRQISKPCWWESFKTRRGRAQPHQCTGSQESKLGNPSTSDG